MIKNLEKSQMTEKRNTKSNMQKREQAALTLKNAYQGYKIICKSCSFEYES